MSQDFVKIATIDTSEKKLNCTSEISNEGCQERPKKGIITDTFMLRNKTAKELYECFAKDQPIIDYHCHLIPEYIAKDHRFENAFELFLGGDHYKWRQMRSYGIDEKYITGDADPYEKFLKWAEVLPRLIGNPLYHWNALELSGYFGIEEPLCPENAKEIWDKVNALLATENYSAKKLISNSGVKVVCTTDDPADDLRYHKEIAEDKDFKVKVYPSFRPDKCLEINNKGFEEYLAKAGVSDLAGLLKWLCERIDFFDSMGCRISDHALTFVPFGCGDASEILKKKLRGETVSFEEESAYKTELLLFLAQEYEKRGWAMQLHVGALRNNNAAMFERLGPDTGYDSANDLAVAAPLASLLGEMSKRGELPKIILYSLNPKDHHSMATIMGSFQSAPVKSRIQLGSGWWFNDTKDGMELQIKTLASLGILSAFVGMLTDSRSFVSYKRHDYFRRILCNVIGDWVENGEYPDDRKMLGEIISGICYGNAKEYFGF